MIFTQSAGAAESDLLETSVEMAGVCCAVRTNSAELIATLESFSSPASASERSPFFSLSVRVEKRDERIPEGPRFRGSNHLVFASFGSSVFVFDLLRRQVSACVSAGLVADDKFWKNTIFPIAMGVFGPMIGVVPLHSACVVLNGDGLLIAGLSGAGKSTLAVALAECGFELVSDDWTYISDAKNVLRAHGLAVPVKLLPDAVTHFPQLQQFSPHTAMNGEVAFEVEASHMQLRQALCCQPKRLLFLSRVPETAFEITAVDTYSAREFFERSAERLPHVLSAAARQRSSMIERLTTLPCLMLRYGGPPHVAAKMLRKYLEERVYA